MEVACLNDCSNAGTCFNGTCTCQFGFLEDDCSTTFVTHIGTGLWYFHVATFTMLFTVITVISLVQVARIAYYRKSLIPNTPQALILFVAFTGALRTVWHAIDPWGFRKIFSPIVDSVLYGVGGTYCLESVYILILVLWADAYHRASGTTNSILSKLKPIGTITIIVLAFLEVAVDVLRTLPEIDFVGILLVYFTLCAIILVTLMVGYLYYGLKLYRNLKLTNVNTNTSPLRQVTILGIGATTTIIITFVFYTIVVSLETMLYEYKNWTFFYVTHWIFRPIECFYCGLVLYILRSAPQQAYLESKRSFGTGSTEDVSLPKIKRSSTSDH